MGNSTDSGAGTIVRYRQDRRLHAGLWPVHALVWLLLAVLIPAVSTALPADDIHPLEPPDTFSPRGTLATLTDSFDKAWRLYTAGDPAWKEHIRNAKRCLDVSSVPPKVADDVAIETALLLKEILDRIELPPSAQIPGKEEVQETELKIWTLPYTEITIARMEGGERDGEFLFTDATVRRSKEFYDRVRHLPYQKGKEGAHYDQMRFGADSKFLGNVVASLPAWFKREVGDQLLWQWLGLALLGILTVGLGVLVFRAGRRWTRPPAESRGWSLLAPFLFPLAVIGLALVALRLITHQLTITGFPFFVMRLAITAIGYLAGAWLTTLAVTRVAEIIIRAAHIERPLSQQLIRMSSRALALLLVAVWLFIGGQALGLPVSAIIAGLGVGGLAVALAAQSTVENFIGGISLYADQPVRVGDFCRFGDKLGVLEEVGLRSAKLRTLERSIVTIPNADFAKLQLENLSRRDRILFRATLRLRYETSRDQLRDVLERMRELLAAHPKTTDEPVRVRLVGFGSYSLDVEIFVYVLADDWSEFLAIREELLLEAMAIVEEAGTRLAVPAEIHYAAEDQGLDADRTRAAENRAREKEPKKIMKFESDEGSDAARNPR